MQAGWWPAVLALSGVRRLGRSRTQDNRLKPAISDERLQTGEKRLMQEMQETDDAYGWIEEWMRGRDGVSCVRGKTRTEEERRGESEEVSGEWLFGMVSHEAHSGTSLG
jgi:hypothetical protein